MRATPFVGIFLSLAGTVATAEEYRIVEIESPSLAAYARGINDAGQVLVELMNYHSGDEERRFILWEDGYVRDVNPAGSDVEVQLRSINDTGLGVGFAARGDEEGPAMWRDGEVTFLPMPETSTGHRLATDVNDLGDVVGFVFEGEQGSETARALLWRDGRVQDLGSFGARFAMATQVNRRGQVLVSAQGPDDTMKALVWKDGVVADIGGDATRTIAIGINDGGQVAGTMRTVAGGIVAFLWKDGELDLLPPLHDHTSSYAHVLTEAGVVIGESWKDNETKIVRWQDGAATDITDSILGLEQWDWVQLTDVNVHGWMAGHGLKGGMPQAFVLVPIPEPSLLSVMLVLLSSRARNDRVLSANARSRGLAVAPASRVPRLRA